MTIGNRLRFDTMRTLGYASTGAGYTAIGTPLAYAASQVLIQNLTDATLIFSFDGVNDHFVLPGSGYFLDDITTNKVSPAGGLYLSANTQLWVKQVTIPTVGSVYFSVTYIAEQ